MVIVWFLGKGFHPSLWISFLLQAVDLKSSNILSPYSIEVTSVLVL